MIDSYISPQIGRRLAVWSKRKSMLWTTTPDIRVTAVALLTQSSTANKRVSALSFW